MALRGVNLGGWLILEKWITPSLFEGMGAHDEISFCRIDRQNNYKKLSKHRDSFITKDDFAWLARSGIDAVRIPIGYWALEDDDSFVNCRSWLDKAFAWAEDFGLMILLDLHGAPGSQNGNDHSGKMGEVGWNSGSNIARTLDVLTGLAQRYGKSNKLWGIELLNEPGRDIPLKVLRDFYERGYMSIRKKCDDHVAVIISDAFRPGAWQGFMSSSNYKNVMLDMHLYQCFSPADKKLDLAGHLKKTRIEWQTLIGRSDKPVVIGEWSLGLDPKTFAGMDKIQQRESLKDFADAQKTVFDNAAAQFFWTYKTETPSGWNFRRLRETSVLYLAPCHTTRRASGRSDCTV